ncbi:hypothetical protein A2634_04990 [Candidatus Amesbacteria bacterium RIFCSPHIGHO2_01_FULL_48_32]|uniref:Glycosyl transferase family 1 domain-containing protein n=1 Tax=Candidatus Amesbacteria bacterium RIFCSPLOWO2_01_FULL_48_25 TaxID=1797259 RepID=A0A1F4ZEY4_9BACT|nr:MAG: hypothetical protein A2634_04990 [Candidatus Amesbacteria bacterium RIFCSPHIGHO2_01_FULL_48_32]OGD04024.1 MAG: hypothetical protein A2989_01340 [Candidatus Amesbacteria bacterium RIFCSPLOWO2_01_FULL_48_25]HJZ05712.1 glycosyltransferase family 4 protein [Patescibacteria group bacterium]
MKRAGIHNPYWDSLGGGERYTAAFVKLLLDQSWQVDILWPKDISASIKDRFGIDVSAAKFMSRSNYPLSTIPYSLLFWVSDGSLPTSLAKITIVHFQFPLAGIGGKSLPNLIKSRLYKFVANSQLTKETVDHEFGVSCQVIYPPIDTSLFKTAKKQNLIIYIGRFSHLTQLKNHSVLIDTFYRLHSKIPGWKLILAGGTSVGTTVSTISNLKDQARGLPIEFVLDPDFKTIRDLCSRAKIFWSASGFTPTGSTPALKTEHFGITVVEAMAAGAVPVITNLGGHKEIVEPGHSGFLWDNLAELQSFTVRLISDSDLANRLSQAAIVRSKIFDISQFNQKFAKFI